MTRHAPHKLIPESFFAVPSLRARRAEVEVVAGLGGDLEMVGVLIGPDEDVPGSVGVTRGVLAGVGFTGRVGQTLVVPGPALPEIVVVGIGPAAERSDATLRNAAAAFARAGSGYSRLGIHTAGSEVHGAALGRVIVEGVLLARYRYTALKTAPTVTPLTRLEIAVTGEDLDLVRAGARAGEALAAAENITRDLANTPPGHLTAVEYAGLIAELGPEFGLGVEVYDRQRLIEMGCGGLLGVNAGSSEEPRMIVVRYHPDDAEGYLALVGKGIMYDSGGISLKPSDPMHFSMKMDMAGSAAVFGAMTALRELGCRLAVTGWLMCTDNMPSGSATKLGDVLTARGGTTVEVRNTDAEGRLVMMDALVLASEEHPDAIIDIATLTGAALRALGTARAVVLGNDQSVVDAVLAAADRTDEKAWQFPLERAYRAELESEIADIANMGGENAGATTAALFLEEFVDGIPWAHIDIAGTMRAAADDGWRSRGATGYGARLLADLACAYRG
jgi:leucyl aminopeptidase